MKLKYKIIALTCILMFFVSALFDVISYAFNNAGAENVQFSCYFETEEGNREENTTIAINDNNINLCMEINVKQQGYLDGEIELKNPNFKFKQEEIEGVSSISENKLTLKQINGEETITIKAGLETNLKTSINQFNKDNIIALKGKYTNATGGNSEINIEQNPKILIMPESYEENEAINLNTEIITNKIYNIEGENQRIVQMQISSGLNGAGFPIKQTALSIEIPEEVKKVELLDRGTMATNGNIEGKNDENSLQYTTENNKVNVQINNQEKDEKISYYKGGKDNLIITLVYDANKEITKEKIKTISEIQLYDQEESIYFKETINEIKEEIEGIIAYSIISQDELYKGNIYAGAEQEYKTSSQVDIRYPQIEKNIKIIEGATCYTKEEGAETNTNNKYLKTTLSKQELLRVLGEQGEIVVKKVNGEETKINSQTLEKEENILTIEYPKGQKEIEIYINNAQNTGTITMLHEKIIEDEKKSREEIKQWKSLEIQGTLKEIKAHGNINLKEPQTKAEIEMSSKRILAGRNNESVEIKATLVTNENKYDLYKNPVIELEFPKEIQEVEINNINLLYGGELVVKNQEVYTNENNNKVLKAEFAGEQTEYINAEFANGTSIIFNCDITVEPLKEDAKSNIIMRYSNEQAIEYDNNGEKEIEVNYVVTKEAKVAYENYAKEAGTQEEVEQGAITVTKSISVGENSNIFERQVQKYTIKIKNNTDKEIKNITVKDSIPNELIYCDATTNNGFYNEYKESEKTEFTQKIDTLKAGEEKSVYYFVRVKQSSDNLDKKVGTKAIISIEGEEKTYESNLVENTIKESKFQIDTILRENATIRYIKDAVISYKIVVKNISNEDLKNATITARSSSWDQFCTRI